MSKVVLVTGCRSGFGLEIAVEAARAGHVVYAGLRDLSTAGELEQAATGLDVTPVQLDVTSGPDREAAVARVLEERGRIDALVNNAGIAIGGFLEDLDDDELRSMFEVNVFGAWAMTNAVLPAMRGQGAGTIVDISSTSGRFALPGLGGYAASKHALEGMSEARRHELLPFGIHVCLVEPGPFKTEIFGRNRRVARRSSDADSPYARFAARVEHFAEQAVLRAGDPHHIARYVVALLDQRRPALRHPIGPYVRSRLLARQLLPFRAIEVVIGRALRG